MSISSVYKSVYVCGMLLVLPMFYQAAFAQTDSGPPVFTPRITPTSLEINISDPDGTDTNQTMYQWQRRDLGTDWVNTITTTMYTVAAGDDGTFRYRAIVTHFDNQGNRTEWESPPIRAKLDDDGDGLIDLYYLEDLDSVRYQVDGTGYKASEATSKTTSGCPPSGCRGYELRRSLDFGADNSYLDVSNRPVWRAGMGWLPITQNLSATDNPFNTTFDGNGYTISRLHINRSDSINNGLFGHVGSNTVIEDLRIAGTVRGGNRSGGLVGRMEGGRIVNSHAKVLLTNGHTSQNEGASQVGGLVGFNEGGNIIACSATADRLSGFEYSGKNEVGGLVGRMEGGGIYGSYVSTGEGTEGGLSGLVEVGGLVGSLRGGNIHNSYANIRISPIFLVSGEKKGGGLVGEMTKGSISNSYAGGDIWTVGGSFNGLGGLVGFADSVNISNSYAYYDVSTGGPRNGGLVGATSGTVTVTTSYRDRTRSNSVGLGDGRSTVALQSPTAPGINDGDTYHGWSTADWDFGTRSTYPALRYPELADLQVCDRDPDTALPQCGDLLRDQRDQNNGLSSIFFITHRTEQDNEMVFGDDSFSSLRFNYIVTLPYTTEFRIKPFALDSAAMISVQGVDGTEYFSAKHSGDISDVIRLPVAEPTTMTISIGATDPNSYSFRINREPPLNYIPITGSIRNDSGSTSIDEGDTVQLSVSGVSGGLGGYQYRWGYTTDGLANTGFSRTVSQSAENLNIRIPTNFVMSNANSAMLTFTLTIEDNFTQETRMITLTVNKQNDGSPRLTLKISSEELRIEHTVADPDGRGTFAYSWKMRDEGDPSWNEISTDEFYQVPNSASDTARYNIKVTHTDAQAYGVTSYPTLSPFPAKADNDEDGLIDIYYLEDLQEGARDPASNSYHVNPKAFNLAPGVHPIVIEKITSGCPEPRCIGYELIRDLDYADDASYLASGNKSIYTVDDYTQGGDVGWLPIVNSKNDFKGIFNGNNYTISNLSINRDINTADGDNIGLFGVLSDTARIENVGLLNVNIEGKNQVGALVGLNKGIILNSYVDGGMVKSRVGTEGLVVGGLVGLNEGGGKSHGSIANSYANVTVRNFGSRGNAGGLIGFSRNGTRISNSYASGAVGGPCVVGGLIGNLFTTQRDKTSVINNSYASGAVTLVSTCATGTIPPYRIAGLAAINVMSVIERSYATGSVQLSYRGSRVFDRGGLIARNEGNNPVTRYSYWDKDTSGLLTLSAGGTVRSTTELQNPTDATGIYGRWSTDDWDFGTMSTYPLLRYAKVDCDLDSDTPAPPCSAVANACDLDPDTPAPLCGALLPGQLKKGLSGILFWVDDEVLDSDKALGRVFSSSVLDYTIDIPNADAVQLNPYAFPHSSATISITRHADNTEYFLDKHSGNLSVPLPLTDGERTTLTVVLTNGVGDGASVSYRFMLDNLLPIAISGFAGLTAGESPMIDEGETLLLSPEIRGGNPDRYRYLWEQTEGKSLNISRNVLPLNVLVPTDFLPADVSTSSVVFRLTVSDNFYTASTEVRVIIHRVQNGLPELSPTITPRSISVSISDIDGDGTAEYQWQRRDANTDWMNTVTMNAQQIPENESGDARYLVRVTHTDGQGDRTEWLLGPYRADLDDDNNGLIDIYYLEDLDALRNSLDGTTYNTQAQPESTSGCIPEGCNGYELKRSLSFNNDDSYLDVVANKNRWTATDASGWQPVGDAVHPFSAAFYGQAYTISDVRINNDDLSHVGLFGYVADTLIRDMDLLNTSITATFLDGRVGALVGETTRTTIENVGVFGATVSGSGSVGGLVGINGGTISDSRVNEVGISGGQGVGALVGKNIVAVMNSRAIGSVAGSTDVGGLVGNNAALIINSYSASSVEGNVNVGGLVGLNTMRIVYSYASGAVRGIGEDNRNLGGLVGLNEGRLSTDRSVKAGFIVNTYATVQVSSEAGDNLGGLVGTLRNGEIENSYAVGNVETTAMGSINAGGLVGFSDGNAARIKFSYWDSERSKIAASAGGTSATTVELQTPIAPGTTVTEVYYTWSASDWDFGDEYTYPVLRYGSIEGAVACDEDTASALPRCGTLLSGQREQEKGLEALFFVIDDDLLLDNDEVFTTDAPFSSLVFEHDASVPYTKEVKLIPVVINPEDAAAISIKKQGKNREYFAGKTSGELSDGIVFATTETQATIEISIGESDPTVYLININKQAPTQALGVDIRLTDQSNSPLAEGDSVDEGDAVNIVASVIGGSEDYLYSWEVAGGESAVLLEDHRTSALNVRMPVDFVSANRNKNRVTFRLTVSDHYTESTANSMLSVQKIDNGPPKIRLTVEPGRPGRMSVESLGGDPDGDQLDLSDELRNIRWWKFTERSMLWGVRDKGDTAMLRSKDTDRFYVEAKHRDGQNNETDYTAGPFPADIDTDDDGLIDIYYLDDLNAVRYGLDGSGYNPGDSPLSKITAGCPQDSGCRGYELLRDLDFNTTTSYIRVLPGITTPNQTIWTMGDGWQPIASIVNRFRMLGNGFEGVFDGKGHTISNLYTAVPATNDAGLFGYTENGSIIRDIGLLNVNINIATNVIGSSGVGSLVGINVGEIINAYATGNINVPQRVSVGGLVGANYHNIVNSYSEVTVAGRVSVGGLVGTNGDRFGHFGSTGTIVNSYASGSVTGLDALDQTNTGGLVGNNADYITDSYALGTVQGGVTGSLIGIHYGTVANSYASGSVTQYGMPESGPLIEDIINGEIVHSYWDRTVNPVADLDAYAKTTTELQSPTAPGTMPTDTYYGWSTDNWDFGTQETYPLLRYAELAAESEDAITCDLDPTTVVPLCGALLTRQLEKGLSGILFLSDSEAVDNDAVFDGAFSSLVFNYDIDIPDYSTDSPQKSSIRLNPYAFSPDSAEISITKYEDAKNYFADKRSGDLSDAISLTVEERTTITVGVASSEEDPIPISYNFRINNLPSLVISQFTSNPPGDPPTLDEGDEITFNAVIQGGEISTRRHEWTAVAMPDESAELPSEALDLSDISDQSSTTLTVRIPDNLTATILSRDLRFTLTVEDDFYRVSVDKTVRVRQKDNGIAEFTPLISTSSIVISGADPDGSSTVNYQWRRRAIDDKGWVSVEPMAETSNTYIPVSYDPATRYRVRISYTDDQGYGPFTTLLTVRDVDNDDDGWIELYYLDDLDDIRHQPDGSGYNSGDKEDTIVPIITMGCPTDGCKGYELQRDLDFANADHYLPGKVKPAWTKGKGWEPIPSFTSTLEGNGYTIFGLHINRGGVDKTHTRAGMFADTRPNALIKNISVSGTVTGDYQVGSLVAYHEGTILNSYSSVTVNGHSSVGGLVGFLSRGKIIGSGATGTVRSVSSPAGGLVGFGQNFEISNSYATGAVQGHPTRGGGLIGNVLGGNMKNVYATGAIQNFSFAVGGLVGSILDGNPVSITNAYAIGSNESGGLIGHIANRSDLEISDSYWDTETSGRTSSAAGVGKRTEQLQSPTTPTGLYRRWSAADWDFGDTQSYPVLRHSAECNQYPNTALPQCGDLLHGQRDLGDALSTLFFIVDGTAQDNEMLFGNNPFSSLRYNYDVTLPYTTRLQLRPLLGNSTATISIKKDSEQSEYFDGKQSGDLSDVIPLPAAKPASPIILLVSVGDTDPIVYRFAITRDAPPSPTILISADDDEVDEGETARLTASAAGGSGVYQYRWSTSGGVSQDPEFERTVEQNTLPTLAIRIPTDIVSANLLTETIQFTMTAGDSFTESSKNFRITVAKQSDGSPRLALKIDETGLRIEQIEDDPDGVGIFDYTWWQRDEGNAEWSVVSTNAHYPVPSIAPTTARYRVSVRHTDAQAYGVTNYPDLSPFPAKADYDGDGLIDIYYLEELSNIRNELSGEAYYVDPQASADLSGANPIVIDPITFGCPEVEDEAQCVGYELTRDLDFEEDQSYLIAADYRSEWTVSDYEESADTGWQSLGGSFSGTFDGNGFTIYNLQINRDGENNQGLFSEIVSGGMVSNVILVDAKVEGNIHIGALAGINKGTVIGSGVIGTVEFTQTTSTSTVQTTSTSTMQSTAISTVQTTSTSTVSGQQHVGGLIGHNENNVANSYAKIMVEGTYRVGGLVGFNRGRSSLIINSYATGRVTANNRGGGLTGNNQGSVRNSFATGVVDALTPDPLDQRNIRFYAGGGLSRS